MRITKWGECGILCALHLAQHHADAPVGASEIATAQGLDLQYTHQVLQRLRKGGIIESARGPHGGYSLVRPSGEITLREILYAAEGDTFQIICDYAPIHPDATAPSQCADKTTCGLYAVWQDLRKGIDALLEARTLADVLKLHAQAQSLVTLGKMPL